MILDKSLSGQVLRTPVHRASGHGGHVPRAGRIVRRRLSLVLALVCCTGCGPETLAPIVTPAPPRASLCEGYTPKVEERRRGTGAVATAQSKVSIRLTRFAVGADGSAAASQPVNVETGVYDFPTLRSIGARMAGTTNQFLADAILPATGEPMRVGGQRRVTIACRHQLFDVDVLDVAASNTPPAQAAPPLGLPARQDERARCWDDDDVDVTVAKAAKDARDNSVAGRSRVAHKTYRALRNQLITLAEQNPHWARVRDYGMTRNGCPLTVLRIALDVTAPLPDLPALLITGAIHGNEYLGIEMGLATEILEHQERWWGLTLYLAAGGVIYFVPVVNPDGFDADARPNLAGVDLNRNFETPKSQKPFSEPESTRLAQYLKTDLLASRRRLEFSLDYHCCAEAMIWPWAHDGSLPDAPELPDFLRIGQWYRRFFDLRVKRAGQIARTNPSGSTIDYYYANYRTRAVSLEGEGVPAEDKDPKKDTRDKYRTGPEEARLQQHLQFLDAVSKDLFDRHLARER